LDLIGKKWIPILSDAYKEQFTALKALAYRLVLGNLTPQQIDLAFQQSLGMYKYCPNPAEVLAALQIATEKIGRPAPVDCNICKGDGWVTIERPVSNTYPSGYREAVRCTHWKPPTPPPEISTTTKNNTK
jgi:hypothetical protein